MYSYQFTAFVPAFLCVYMHIVISSIDYNDFIVTRQLYCSQFTANISRLSLCIHAPLRGNCTALNLQRTFPAFLCVYMHRYEATVLLSIYGEHFPPFSVYTCTVTRQLYCYQFTAFVSRLSLCIHAPSRGKCTPINSQRSFPTFLCVYMHRHEVNVLLSIHSVRSRLPLCIHAPSRGNCTLTAE